MQILPSFAPVLDILLFLLHAIVILINLTGWAIRPLRRIQRWTLGITLASWLWGALFLQTPGYCFLTDWQWKIKTLYLGAPPPESSFIHFLVQRACRCSVPEKSVNVAVLLITAFIVIATGITWYREKHQKHH